MVSFKVEYETHDYNTMKYSVYLLLILRNGTFLLAGFTNYWEIPEGRIIGGHEAAPHSHPYLISLQTRLLWARLHVCGGALLNENWILTAAHCIRESWLIRWLPLDAVAGANDVEKFGVKAQVINIDKRIHHPLYKGGIGPNDIAVLQTKMPFTFTKEVQPVKLPVNFNDHNKYLTLIGWGALRTTLFIPDLPAKLQEVNVTYLPFNECNSAIEALKDDYEENPLDKDANICTGPLSGGIAACNGDSGGPLVLFTHLATDEINGLMNNETDKNYDSIENDDYNEYDVEDEQGVISKDMSTENENKNELQIPEILGVVSWGVSPCGEKGAPTVYTKVSRYIDFINEHINH